MWGEKVVHTSTWDLKRQFWSKADIRWSLKWRGEISWSLNQNCQLPRMRFPAVTLFHKKGLATEERYMRILWLYSYFTRTLLSNNKNINYIFIDLGVFRWLSSGSMYENTSKVDVSNIWNYEEVIKKNDFAMLRKNWAHIL